MTKRCVNGHYYDGDKFAMCPYCGAGDMDGNVDNGEATIPVFQGEDIFSSSGNTPTASNYDDAGDMATVMLDQPPIGGNDPGFGGVEYSPLMSAPMAQDPDATVSMGSGSGITEAIQGVPMDFGMGQSTMANQDEMEELRKQKEELRKQKEELEKARMEAENARAEAERLKQEAEEAKRQAAAQQMPTQQPVPPAPPAAPIPTAPPASSGPVNYGDLLNDAKNNKAAAADDEKTVRLMPSGNLSTEPIVGWLIGVNGPYYGECFELKNGKNFIGRDSSMDVVLGGDNSVSRIRHAVVLYEPHERIFIAQPGESRELFYINDRVVLKNEQLKPYDIILVGSTKLVFFPLCGSKFSWEDLKEE